MPETELVKYKGLQIKVNHYGTFSVEMKGVKYGKDTLAEIEEIIDKDSKDSRSFKPIDCISVRDHVLARITSRDPDTKNYYRITHENRKGERDLGKRSLERYTGYGDGEAYYYLRTTENMKVLKSIWELNDQIDQITQSVKRLESQLQDPVTREYIDGLIGGPKQ